MDDRLFISRLNKILSENDLRLPFIAKDAVLDGATVSGWVEFLEICVKCGIKLSDERWSRLIVKKQKPVTVLALEHAVSKPDEPDFRVGLQLLLRMLEKEEEKR